MFSRKKKKPGFWQLTASPQKRPGRTEPASNGAALEQLHLGDFGELSFRWEVVFFLEDDG